MDAINNIILNSTEESLERTLSPFIREQFPSFMREDYPKLILFIKAYYEWMEQSGNPGQVISRLDSIYDIDANAEEFFEHFKKTYMVSFPVTFAENPSGNKPNKKTLLKKIRDFYGKKGTESAYKFLFRILYDSDVEFYYPKNDVLKVSDGRWIEPKSIKTTTTNGSNLFSAVSGQIFQYSGTEVIASAFIENVIQYTLNGLPVCEFFINDIVGTFIPDVPVKIVKDSSEWQEIPYSVLGQFFIELPGNGYRVGNSITLIDTSGGFGFSAKVEQVGLAGGIKKISITNSGLNYSADAVVSVFSETGKQTAKVIALKTAVTDYPGYFSGNSGKVSSNKSIYDGNYYQDFSYELKSAVSLDVYFDVLRKLVHPAGMRMFGSILLKSAIENTISTSTQATLYKSPLVGQYTPYSPRTFNNLRLGTFLPNQVVGATLQVWLSTYNVAGNTTDGVSAGWTGAGLTALGVNVWNSLVNGFTFGHYPVYADVWSTPRFKQEAINTHPSLVFRPVNDSTSDLYSASTDAKWRSFGYGTNGPTMGRLGLTASRSYFVVCKPRRIDQLGAIGSASGNGRHIISDYSGFHGIAVGFTGGTNSLKIVAWNSGASRTNWVIADGGATGEWKLISQIFQNGSGNSGPLSLFLNGICLGTTLSASAPISTIDGKTFGIGMPNENVQYCFDGEIAEVVCYQGDVSELDRQKIEGYLAHKYGLAGKLPSAHTYNNVVPGISLSGGTWGGGTTGDFYPKGYNPYIDNPYEIGADGTSASIGSLFYDSGLGYTYTTVDEHGITAHNSTGSPLGSTAAWWTSGGTWANKETKLDPSVIDSLVLWLKPENIGVCGAKVDGASMDVWLDASPKLNHGLPPTWGKFNSDTNYAGVTIDRLRPVMSVIDGITGISFSGGGLANQWLEVSGTGKTLGGLGITFAPGSSGDTLLTAQHFYLKNGITLSADCDVFVVFRGTTGSTTGANISFIFSNNDPKGLSGGAIDTVVSCRDCNAADIANITNQYIVSSGVKRYGVGTSPFVFIPFGSAPGGILDPSVPNSEKRFIGYDPHVSLYSMGRVIGEFGRDRQNTIFAYLNGDRATNSSKSTGLGMARFDRSGGESPLPVYTRPVNFGRFGARVSNGLLTLTTTNTVGTSAWLSDLSSRISSIASPFLGILNEVIVFDRQLNEEERQIVYGYLSRKYRLETKLPDSYVKSHNSAYPLGISYWTVQHHPNTNDLDTIPAGAEFSGIVLNDFFRMTTTVYKSAGTRLSSGITLQNDTYDTVGS